MRKGNNSRSVIVACLSCLWDTVESHYIISQHYVKKFLEDFRHNKITCKTSSRNNKNKYDIDIDFTLPEFSEKNY